MSGTEGADGLDQNSAALEYVIGTLRGKARADFETLLRNDETLQAHVMRWEEQLIGLNAAQLTRMPAADSWAMIENRINPESSAVPASTPGLFERLGWQGSLSWLLAGTFALLLVISVTVYQPGAGDGAGIPIDYMAVMADTEGEAILSAVAEGDARKMWLQWEQGVLSADQDYQLWAVSRSDGEVRSLSVIADSDVQSLQLSEAQWRLVKDAASLLLTTEEEGGSAIDEPGDLVAKGLCIRLNGDNRDV